MNKSQYILVIIAGILALFVFTVALFSFFKPTQQQDTLINDAPTPTANEIQPIQYESTSSERMLEIVKNRTPFTAADLKARNALITKSTSNPLLYTSSNVRVEYLKSPDQFMAEILTGDITLAKNEAVSYLSSNGLSDDAICHLPLIFYLSLQARRSLPSDTREFNPLPDTC